MNAGILFVTVFIFGLIIGSFLNVCVSRIPKGVSIISPRSRCPECLAPISFYDNLPLISYLVLRGNCRHCGVSIPFRYPLVELLTAAITALFVFKWRADIPWLIVSLSAAYLLITVSLIDFETFMIADAFSYALMLLGFVSAFFNPYFNGGASARFLDFFSGGLTGAVIVGSLAWLGKRIYKKEAVGEGDIFLMAGIGALTGVQGVFSTLMFASFFGAVYGGWLILFKKAGRFDHVPFSPFLSLGAVINLYRLFRITDFFIW
ncbi:MAG: prepilin peptidase [Elusimicrobia bacterium]|nr:prepilin peptidase [Elusimicrobiota bacterium]